MLLRMSLCMLLSLGFLGVKGQCPTQSIAGNFTPSNGDTLSGTYLVGGDFNIPAGITVFVRPFASNGCGQLEVIANGNINVAGTINADGAGFAGGISGLAGSANNVQFITSCPSPTSQCGDVFTFGGGSGGNGNPGGGGNGGAVGLDGSGRKNQCQTFNDDGGRVGGSGGAGGGAGGTYGGMGTNGAPGGVGTIPTLGGASTSTCTNNVIAAGFGGNGGNIGSVYGSLSGTDIDLGSAGGGAGGGGRGRFAGQTATPGGAGGGMVKLEAGGNLIFSGLITANGTNGGNGGDGGNAGSSPQCCSDACNGADEYTHTGSGGGGAGGGGGSGGGILLQGNGFVDVTGNAIARGGDGGQGGQGGSAYANSYSCLFGNSSVNCPAATGGGLGGGGGGGRIKVFFNPCAVGNNLMLTQNVTAGNGAGGFAMAGTSYVGSDGSFQVGAAGPTQQTICFNGDPGNLSSLPAQGGFGAIAYQWQAQTGCTGPWSNVAGGNTLNYDPPAGLQATTCYRLVTTSGTCVEFSDTLQVNVIPPLPAVVAPVGPLALCQGDTATLSTSGGTGATYQWAFNGIPIPLANDSILSVANPGAYTVTINYPVGCDAQSLPVNVTVEPPPPAFATALGDTVLCPGETVQLSAFGGGSYQWNMNGNPLPGDTSALLTTNQAGSYFVEVTSAGGCTAFSDTIFLTNSSNPTPVILPQGGLQFCEGDSVQLTAGGAGGNQIHWLYNGALLAMDTMDVTVGGNGNYELVYTNVDGCTDTSTVLAIQVDPSPNADLQPVGIPVTCQGDSTLFLASGNGAFTWLFNGQPLTDTTNFLYASIPGNYAAVVTTPLGCIDTTMTFSFAWYPPSVLDIQTQSSPFVCPGQTIDLEGQITGNANTYQWYRNDTLLPGETNPNLMTDLPGIYSFTSEDANGCTYTSPPFTVLSGQAPQASIGLLGQNPFCPHDSLILLGEGGDVFQWLQDGQVLTGASDSFLVVTTSGDYSLSVETGCGQDTVTLGVTAAPGPIAGFIYDNLPANEINFIDQSISGALWWWDFGDGNVGNMDQNPNHTYAVGGNYTVTMITEDIFGCRDTITLNISVEDPGLFIPNVFTPNQDGVNDLFLTRFDELLSFDFRIYDRWGNALFVTENPTEYWDGRSGGKAVPEGAYFYHLRGRDAQNEVVERKGYLDLLR